MTGPSAAAFALGPFLRNERDRVDAALDRALSALEPLLDEAVREPVRLAVTTGGKRLRPILCVAAYRAAGGDDPAIEDLAVSLELIHAYSLMHDDLPCMDDAPLRRGRATPHVVHGERSTARGAAALIPAAHLQAWYACDALGLPAGARREVVASLARAAGGAGMVGGQALDLQAEGRELGRDELDGLHRRKTGALLTASLRIGGLAAGAGTETIEALEGYGRAIGLAFQIADDVLDATATAQRLGKAPSDAELDKSTYVRLLGVDGARRRARALVDEAVEALRAGGLEAPPLHALAGYVVDRER